MLSRGPIRRPRLGLLQLHCLRRFRRLVDGHRDFEVVQPFFARMLHPCPHLRFEPSIGDKSRMCS